jgi:hypothetical protein
LIRKLLLVFFAGVFSMPAVDVDPAPGVAMDSENLTETDWSSFILPDREHYNYMVAAEADWFSQIAAGGLDADLSEPGAGPLRAIWTRVAANTGARTPSGFSPAVAAAGAVRPKAVTSDYADSNFVITPALTILGLLSVALTGLVASSRREVAADRQRIRRRRRR